ncbi:MAG TPA: S8 family serine peptidase [Thermoanaerobaculia bacterium]|nr:S8 family serine peptidase [Thermoanaerobaculia bacterium]
MRKQLLACLALAALLPLSAGAQEPRATVSPFLEPLVERPSQSIPNVLRGSAGGVQGRKRLAGREALSLHLRTTASREELEALGAHVRTLRDGLATVTILPEDLAALAASPDVSSIALPRMTHPLLSKSLPDTGIPPLRSYSNGSFTGATGAGVVVGVVDSGLDFNHPNFKDAQGHSRIAFLLDQTTGIECTAASIDAGLCAEQDEPTEFGHGTHVTGTAAGNGAAPDENGLTQSHVGVAPESTIVFVKTTFATDDVIDGLEYIFAKADQLGLPAVINLSLGTDVGAHDGTDPMEEEIDNLVTAKAGRAVVVAAGNSRGDAVHGEVKAQLNTSVAGPTVFVPSYTATPGASNDVIIVSGYYASTDDISVLLISPTGEAYNRALTNSGCAAEVNGFDGTVQICNSKVSNLDQGTTAREIAVAIYDGVANKPPKSGAWKISLTGNTIAGNGEVDFWMGSNLGNGNAPAHFSSLVDTSETIAIPGTSHQAITVGAHITRLCWEDYNGNSQDYGDSSLALGDIASFSGFGPTRDGRAKPELSAPGMGVIAPMASNVKDVLVNAGYGWIVVNDDYLLLQGTSMAAPHVTGAVALLLQSNPAASNAILRSILSSNARDDAFTRQHDGLLFNYAFGAGKLDLGHWAYIDPYETNDLSSQAHALLSGQQLGGYIERAADVDYFLLQGVQSGDTINATLTSLPQDYALALQAQGIALNDCSPGSMSTKASSNNAGTANESITYTTTTGFPFLQGVAAFVRVTSSAGATSNNDSYLVKAILTRQETASTHNSTATAQKLPGFVEMNVAGAISAGEQDYYSFGIMPGKTMVLAASGKTITVRDANGTFVKSGSGSVTFTLPPGGFFPTQQTYHAVVSGANGPYTLNLKIQ